MYIISVSGIIAVVAAWLSQFSKSKKELIYSFVVLGLTMAVRYDFGNDYMGYFNGFNEINKTSWNGIEALSHPQYEIGWVFLCRLFAPFGFQSMVFVLSLFNAAVYYSFIRKTVQKKYWWFSVFLYVFNPYFLITHASAMRQTLAISLFILAFDSLKNRRAMKYFFLTAIACLLHTSSIVLFIVYFIVNSTKDYSGHGIIKYILIFSILFITSIVTGPVILEITQQMAMLQRYSYYLDGKREMPGLGFFYNIVILLMLLTTRRRVRMADASIISVTIIYYFVLPFTYSAMMVERIGMYFSIFTIAAFPMMIQEQKGRYSKLVFLLIIVLMNIRAYIQFMQNDLYVSKFLAFKTILF